MNEKEIHLRDYIRILGRRKSTVITFFAVTVLVVVLATFTADPLPMYQSSVRVVIERSTPETLTGYRYGNLGYDPEFLETQSQIIKSQGVAEKVVDAVGAERLYNAYFPEGEMPEASITDLARAWLDARYQSFKEMIGIGAVPPPSAGDPEEAFSGGGPQEPPTTAEIMHPIVRGSIGVMPMEQTRVVSISYTSPNPVLSKTVADTVAQAYIDQLLDMRMEISGYSIEWMSKKAEEQRKKLEEAEHKLHAYKREHNIITIEDRLAILPERLAEFSRKLTRAEARRKELEAVYNQVKNRPTEELETVSVIAEHAGVDAINRDIREAEQQISDFSEKYGPRHPRMIAANNDLVQLLETKHREIQKAVKTVENEYALARDQERAFQKMLDETKFEAARLNEQSIQLDIIKRQVETNKNLYNALLRRMEEEGLTERSQSVNVWVIENAGMPAAPMSQGNKKNIVLGLVLGLMGGVGLAFFFEYLDNTVKSPEDVEERFDLPLIGAIEKITDKNRSAVDIVMAQESSSISENFKTLRTAILLSAPECAPRVLLVTSMGAKEGKSTVASCLAVSMARNGLGALLVDADMRRPQIHSYFNIENETGLSALLAGSADGDICCRNHIPNLDILPSGAVPPNPSELLSSGRLDRLLQKSREKYDMVILDSPPLGVSDAMILGKKSEGVLLVARAGQTRYEMLQKAAKMLREVSAPVTGIVLNGFDAKKAGYYLNYSEYYYSEDKG